MATKNFGLRNPLQCADAIQDKQLVISSNFCKITEENLRDDKMNENSPQMIFGKFSRFVFSILDGGSVTSNIKIDQLADIRRRTDFASELQYKYELDKLNGFADIPTDVSVAYTEKFKFGDYKGWSPAQILLDKPDDGGNILNSQFKMLKTNVAQHPENEQVLEAIRQAAALRDRNALDEMQACMYADFNAYKTRFVTGNLKGKTPAQVMIESDDGRQILDVQYEFLKKNADKYEMNRRLMFAIHQAERLQLQGKLDSKVASESKTKKFEILKEQPKPNKYKTVDIKDANGNPPRDANGNVIVFHPTHSIHIFYSLGSEYPITVEIKNYNCPIKEAANGSINAIISETDRETSQHLAINLSLEKWNGLVAELERQVEIFAIMNGNEAFKLANKINYENRQQNTQ